MRALSDRPVLAGVLAACVLLAVIVGAQALAATSPSTVPTVSAASALGDAGFAYLGGLRTFAAALLWNRLEPQYHQYGEGKSISERVEFLPTIHLVQLLDPQFEQSYYVAAFVLAKRGNMDRALDIAREGIEKNPHSGLLRASYVQILMMQDKQKNLSEMLHQAKMGLAEDATWANGDDQFEGYGIFRVVFESAGDTATAAALGEAQDDLKQMGAAPGAEREAGDTVVPSL